MIEDPLVAFRAWRVTDSPATLCAVVWESAWVTSGVTVAECLRCYHQHDAHDVPAEQCECGLYAYDRIASARCYMESRPSLYQQPLVLGAVRLWGRIRVGDVKEAHVPRGAMRLRAQFGQVLALRAEDPHAARVGRATGLPIVSESYLEAFAREWGRQLPHHPHRAA